MLAVYNYKPDEISYMSLPDGRADVWLRKSITETVGEDSNTVWECEEISFRTALTEEEIIENINVIWENGGPVIDEETEEEVADGVTLEQRVEANEEAIVELAELVAELAG